MGVQYAQYSSKKILTTNILFFALALLTKFMEEK